MAFAQLALLALGSAALSAQPLDTILVLEMSPGTEQPIGLIRARDFSEPDRAAVVGFLRTAGVLQPLTIDHKKIDAALRRARLRVGVAIGNGSAVNYTVDIASAIRKACAEFDEAQAAGQRRAVIVLFAGEDPALASQVDSLASSLSAVNARLYAVSVPRVNEGGILGLPRVGTFPSPVLTNQLMSELAKNSGGRIYKRNWDLSEILKEARKP